MKRWWVVGAGLAAAGLLSACTRYVYHVELKPDREGMERSLRWETPSDGRRVTQMLSGEELGRVAALYGSEAPEEPTAKASFTGRFHGQMPKDIGGSGEHTTLQTSLGATHIYIERFRGQDDLLAQLEAQQRAADVAIDVLLGWAESRAGQEPGFERLKAWADGDLRRDWKNMSLYLWLGWDAASREDERQQAAGLAAGDKAQRGPIGEFGARAARYLLDRGYLKPGDVPTLCRLAAGDDRQALILLGLARRELARRLGHDVPAALEADLASVNALRASLGKYLDASEAARGRLGAWARETGAENEDPLEQLSLVVFVSAPIPFFREHDNLTVDLAVPGEPLATSGVYDAGAGRVRWIADIETKAEDRYGLPKLAYAIWAEPDGAAQRARLGEAALTGDALVQYCVWRTGLDEPHAREWEAFLGTLRPGMDLRQRLGAFRFVGEPKSEDPSRGVAAILNALR